MTKRAALYARVSGDDRGNEGRNLAGQLDMCREYALSHGYTVVAELAEDDRGASGVEMDLPQLSKALEMAQAGGIDVLVVREIDRFARSLAKQLIVETEFRRAGVLVEYVLGEYPDTPEGNLNKNLKAVIAEYERLKITERMVRGRRQKVKRGSLMLHGNNPPMGYRLVVDGNFESLEVDEAEAYGVRLIFQWYVTGDEQGRPLSTRGITKRLNDQSVYHPRGRWSRTTVERILKSETYAGVWHYGKSGKGTSKRGRNPRAYWIPVRVPPIVDRKTWDAAQERRRRNYENSRRNGKYHYLLARRVTCGECGTKMGGCGTPRHGTGKPPLLYYRCPVARKRCIEYTRECDNGRYFRTDQVDAVVWSWVKTIVADSAQLSIGMQTYRAKQEQELAPLRERLRVVDDLLTDSRRQLAKVLDLYLEDAFTKELLTERKARLETTLDSLTRERTALSAKIEAGVISDDQIASIQVFAASVTRGLEKADSSFEARRGIVEALDVQVSLTVEDGRRVAYASCVIGEEAMLIVPQPTCRRMRPASRSPVPARRSARAARTAPRR